MVIWLDQPLSRRNTMKSKSARLKASRSVKSQSTLLRRRTVEQAPSTPAVTLQGQGLTRAAIAKSVSGQVVEERSGLPLAGVTVRWTIPDTPRNPRAIVLGSGITDGDGRFLITAGDNVETKTALCRIDPGGDVMSAKTLLSLVDRRGKILGRPFEVAANAREIVLRAPTSAKAGKPQWKALANYLVTNRLMLVRDVAQQLSRPFAGSPVTNWTVPERASALRAMLDAIAAENKKLAGQVDLLEQDQFLETTSLASGSLGRAVTLFKDEANIGKFVGDFGSLYPWLRESDLSLYRDYLRGVWVAAAQKMYEDALHAGKPAVSLFERQLDERFQQDFHTHNDASLLAAKLP